MICAILDCDIDKWEAKLTLPLSTFFNGSQLQGSPVHTGLPFCLESEFASSLVLRYMLLDTVILAHKRVLQLSLKTTI